MTRYQCRYCDSFASNKNDLYEHIRNSESCSERHYSRNTNNRAATRRSRNRNYVRRERPNGEIRQRVQHTNQTTSTTQNNQSVLDNLTDVRAGENDARACTICFENLMRVISSCGHATCISCSNQLNECPQCRQQWRVIAPVFL